MKSPPLILALALAACTPTAKVEAPDAAAPAATATAPVATSEQRPRPRPPQYEATAPAPTGAPPATCWARLGKRRVETPCAYELTEEFVTDLQRALAARQAYDGPVTGRLDAPTRAALQGWQAAQGHDTDILLIATARSFGLIPYPLGGRGSNLDRLPKVVSATPEADMETEATAPAE